MSTLVQHAYAPCSTQPQSAPSEHRPPEQGDPFHARAMALAGVGVWSCSIPHDHLSWTSGVYDLFGLPAGTRVDRRQTVEMYVEESRDTLERLRTQAIAHCGTFTLDAQIIRADGALRWMRITGEMVRGADHAPRLHGLKQDITREKLRWEAMRQLAENDALTGLANRAIYESRFLNRKHANTGAVPLGALVLFDLDGFKEINDRFGHAAGDACLRAFAERLLASFPEALLTARIGGDEFALLVDAGTPTVLLQTRVARFLELLRAPVLWQGHLLVLAASTGMAIPANPCFYDAEELFINADAALYAAKRARQRARA